MSTCLSIASWSNLQRTLDFSPLRNLASNELFFMNYLSEEREVNL